MNRRRTSGLLSVGLSLALATMLAARFLPANRAAPPAVTVTPPMALKAPAATRPIVLPPPPLSAVPPPPKPAEPPRARPRIVPLQAMPEPTAAKTASPKPKTNPPVAAPLDPNELSRGRALLRILEHGAGPSVEIAWPEGAADRDRLFRVFRDCFAMEMALMDRDGRLYTLEGPPRQAWAINMDRYSGFVRQPAGRLTVTETRRAREIRRHHGGLGDAAMVRLFPRRVDALLLGGLRRLIGGGYGNGATIRAAYRLSSGRVGVNGVRIDGRPIPGRLDLSAAARPCRGA